MDRELPEFEPYEWREDSFDNYTETYIRYVIYIPEAWFEQEDDEDYDEAWEDFEDETVEIQVKFYQSSEQPLMVEDVEVIFGELYCIEHDCMEESSTRNVKIGFIILILALAISFS